ncbi:MAG: ATP-binding cassette domain-containing protein [Gemmatimonadetes bacterium]|nr:ATP-binding cassette domain-containing protein [Gemmatimonadota bacterium]
MTAAISATQLKPRLPLAEWPDPVSLEVDEGGWVVIRTTPARSGALLRLCVGLDEPAPHGNIELLGHRPGQLRRDAAFHFRRALGVALQPDGLVSNLPMLRNLVVPLVYSGQRSPDEADRRARAVLDALHLGDWTDARPSELPPDLRQVAALARALAPEPKLLLLEDPLNAVRSRQALEVLEYCKRQVPTALVTVFRRSEPLYDLADALMLWDARGLVAATEGVA